MTGRTVIVGVLLIGGSLAHAQGPNKNPVYQQLRQKGLTMDGTHIDVPAPSVPEEGTADQERAALLKIAGSPAAVKDMTYDSVTADDVLKKHNVKTKDGNIRVLDLWFIVYANLDEFDPEKATSGAEDGKPVGAGNMMFVSKKLDASALAAKGIKLAHESGTMESYSVFNGKLLENVEFQTTNHVLATRGNGSWIIANDTATQFDDDPALKNTWHSIDTTRKGANIPHAYAGGGGYSKITKLKSIPGAVLVEVHSAFYEPNGWFGGDPILESKINIAAKKQIRTLRVEIKKHQEKHGKG